MLGYGIDHFDMTYLKADLITLIVLCEVPGEVICNIISFRWFVQLAFVIT